VSIIGRVRVPSAKKVAGAERILHPWRRARA
jgi:hypothetical protein